jgi:histone-arginine methyltransferase CARM1
LTHWYQVRCLLETPIFVKQGQLLTGTVLLLANKRFKSLNHALLFAG